MDEFDLDGIDEDFNENNEDPEWMQGFKEESLQAVVNREEIFPTLNPRLNAVYTVKVVKLPKVVNTQYGKSRVILVDYDNMTMSLFINESFRFNLIAQMRRHNLKPMDLIGKTLVFQKVEGEIDGSKTNLMKVQIKL